MAKRYVEVTIALDDATPDTLEVSHRTKEDEEPWSEPSEPTNNAPTSIVCFGFVDVEIRRKI